VLAAGWHDSVAGVHVPPAAAHEASAPDVCADARPGATSDALIIPAISTAAARRLVLPLIQWLLARPGRSDATPVSDASHSTCTAVTHDGRMTLSRI
jgi:hypothetical protein